MERRDLYSGLENFLGPERASLLMRLLPPDSTQLATKSDLASGFAMVDQRFEAIDQRFEMIDRRFEGIDQRFLGIDARLDHMDGRITGQGENLGGRIDALGESLGARIDGVNMRLDRLFLTVGAAIIAMLVAVFTDTILG